MGLTENDKKKSKSKKLLFLGHRNAHPRLMQPQREQSSSGSSSLPEPGAVGPGCQSRATAPPAEDGVTKTPLSSNDGLLHFPSISLDGLPARGKGLHFHVAQPLSCQDTPPPHPRLRPQLLDPPALCTALSKGRELPWTLQTQRLTNVFLEQKHQPLWSPFALRTEEALTSQSCLSPDSRCNQAINTSVSSPV